ncbi:prepilin-type N-terminal cleavage/methylation domain-containing protein [Sulfurovum sp. zt1-1]|uniref:Prepilin-type N-terminal cleavage/methylation domain-containing protein n=1 Tax=Sulfurovum zhangzhouensis TaxID=3019067 RepID=A0ABT7QX66_9BACT|nr:prepilin-type N-terminal cleavage/methylation domain-containing protein [Sulfurovum zhangzhouensis]MDM5271425.1 prepilin-type N-terminal cleavage/methylation domain-containing protein [Sulfurovum zhangzhouensis]
MVGSRKAFTMIEMVFVIVVIGILAAVAIPKLAANRANTEAKVCENEAATLLQEISGFYAKNGYFDNIERMSNLRIGITETSGNGQNGIINVAGTVPAVNDATGISYACNGDVIVTYTAESSTYTDANGVIHNQVGMVAIAGIPSALNIPGTIALADFNEKSWFKASPGYVIGGN